MSKQIANEYVIRCLSYSGAAVRGIAYAIRMSSAIPGILTPVKYNGSLYGDAGVLINMLTNLYHLP